MRNNTKGGHLMRFGKCDINGKSFDCPKGKWGGRRACSGRKRTCVKKVPFNRRINENILKILSDFAKKYEITETEAIESDNANVEPLRIGGSKNFFLLIGVILCVAFVNVNYIPEMGNPHGSLWIKYLREIILIGFILVSMDITKKKTRELKGFSWTPIYEVAALFLGIFITMVPALLYLKENAASFGLSEGWQFYFMSGSLSSFLDNAPTAVAMHGVALGLVQEGAAVAEVAGVPELLLTAISMGSVLFGSMTYIGNGPNFMVKAIAESSGIKMPSFFGYIFKFSLVILLPLYILTYFLFV